MYSTVLVRIAYKAMRTTYAIRGNEAVKNYGSRTYSRSAATRRLLSQGTAFVFTLLLSEPLYVLAYVFLYVVQLFFDLFISRAKSNVPLPSGRIFFADTNHCV